MQMTNLIHQSLIVENKDFSTLLEGLNKDDSFILITVILTTYSIWHNQSLLMVDAEDDDDSEEENDDKPQDTKKVAVKVSHEFTCLIILTASPCPSWLAGPVPLSWPETFCIQHDSVFLGSL